MAYPTGTGSEVIRRGLLRDLSNATTSFTWNGTSPTAGTANTLVPSLHIVTVVSIIITDTYNTDETLEMGAHDGAGQGYIMKAQSIPASGVFVWNDKFSLIGGDYLKVVLTSTGVVDLLYTYIDQNWEN